MASLGRFHAAQTEQAPSPLRLYFILHTLYFILHITMRCMVETQYDGAGSISTASLLYTSYFRLHTSYMRCMVETQYDEAGSISTASLLHTSYFRLYTSYFIHALHGGDAVRRSRLHHHCVSTSYFILPTSDFIPPCVAWWRRSTTEQAPSPLRLYFILHTSDFRLYTTMRCMVETQYDGAGSISAASLLPTLYFILHTSRGNPSKLSPFGLEGLGEDRGCMRVVRHRRWGDELFAHRYEYIIAGLDEAQMSNT